MRLRRKRAVENVFVLNTGRCGSVTFSQACQHLTNWSAGHETLSRVIGDERLNYPSRHIEVDNRLSWFLGLLGQRFPDAYFVHLRRDREAVAASFAKRLGHDQLKASIIAAFAHGIVQRRTPFEGAEHLDVCRFYVDSVTANIDEFLRDRPHMTIWLESAPAQFAGFLERIDARGDLDAACAEWGQVYNASA